MAKIRIKRSTLRKLKYVLLALLAVGVIILAICLIPWKGPGGEEGRETPRRSRVEPEPEPVKEMYGIVYNALEVETEEVKTGQTLSHLLGGMGMNSATIDKVARTSKPVFDMTKMKAGNEYTAFFSVDTAGYRKLMHFVYQESITDFVVVSFINDSIGVRKFQKEVEVVRRKETAKIESSLWNSMVANNMPASLSVELENIYGWSVNFFALQPEDEFTIIFDERSIEGQSIGTGRVWGAVFHHKGKDIYAIPFKQDGKITYWDEQGNSMKKQFLKAPLKYTRISSTFSRSRLHPIYNVRRPHLGVDYAAPVGTSVLAIADGTVTDKRWDSKGGGNILKIKHSNNYISTYMHLSKYASGIKVGSYVQQGQKIAEVGSTGASTGPHLDFRMQKGGEYINPLNLPSGSSEPVKQGNRAAFNAIKDRVVAELKGEVADSLKVTSL